MYVSHFSENGKKTSTHACKGLLMRPHTVHILSFMFIFKIYVEFKK